MEMDPQPGYAMASWERGYGDFHLTPDLARCAGSRGSRGRRSCSATSHWEDGSPVVASPRQVLRGAGRAGARGRLRADVRQRARVLLAKETYAEAHAKHYRDLTPSVPYILDYHILATTYDEPFIRQIRNGMHGAGIAVESSKGEAWPGQQEINFRYADALTMADNHVIYKNGAKEIAHQNGCSITFMAKPDHSWIGNSCHIHASLWRDGENAFAGETECSSSSSPAGSRARGSWRSSSRRRSTRTSATPPASWAPTTLAWGHDNRTCGVPHRRARRVAARRDADPRRRRQSRISRSPR